VKGVDPMQHPRSTKILLVPRRSQSW